MTSILVVNCGSSSIKYQLIDAADERMLATGLIERIGENIGLSRHRSATEAATTEAATSEAGALMADEAVEHVSRLPIADHTAGFAAMLAAFREHGPDLDQMPPVAIGHRVVHGGERFVEPTLIDERVRREIDLLSSLAPLHNPPNLAGIHAAQITFPNLPHVAVFDTAFHHSLSPAAYSYAIDARLAADHGVRRYGFHGTSHKFVSEAAAAFLDRSLEQTNTIVLHLGNGASACAVEGGRSVETSMGMTPLEGLVMGTRSGDIDPAVLFHLHRKAGFGIDQLDTLLNRSSGLLGMAGTGDMRDVLAAAAVGDPAAVNALEVYLHRLKAYVGAYYAQLGRVDAIVFTAGVGENNALIRGRALAGLEGLGIRIDSRRNEDASREIRRISADDSAVAVLVVPTNEELEIARQTLSVVEAPGPAVSDPGYD